MVNNVNQPSLTVLACKVPSIRSMYTVITSTRYNAAGRGWLLPKLHVKKRLSQATGVSSDDATSLDDMGFFLS